MTEADVTDEEVDRSEALTQAIARLLDGEPDRNLRFSALAMTVRTQAFLASRNQQAALQHIELIGEVAGERLLEDWDDMVAIRRRGAN